MEREETPSKRAQRGNTLSKLEALKMELEAKKKKKINEGKGATAPTAESHRDRSSTASSSSASSSRREKENKEKKKDKKKDKSELISAPVPVAPPTAYSSADDFLDSLKRNSLTHNSNNEVDVEAFEEMMADLSIPEVQRAGMRMLPDSHKQTLILQWRKKKLLNQETLKAPPTPPTIVSTSVLQHAPIAPPTFQQPANSLANNEEATEQKEGDDEEEMKKLRDQKRQEKLDALRKLKEELAKKRELVNQQTAQKQKSDQVLNSLLGDLKAASPKTSRSNRKIAPATSKKTPEQMIQELERRRASRRLRRQERQQAHKTENINSVSDLQFAIKRSDASRRPKSRMQSGIPPPTAEDVRIRRESRRLRRESRRLDIASKEIHIDSQLTGFIKSLVKLEAEFRKQEELRLQKDAELAEMRKDKAKMERKVQRLEDSLQSAKKKMDVLGTKLEEVMGRNLGDKELGQCRKDLDAIKQDVENDLLQQDVIVEEEAEEPPNEEATVSQTEEKDDEPQGAQGSLPFFVVVVDAVAFFFCCLIFNACLVLSFFIPRTYCF
ncbi:hypothetical protein QOT17_019159 [Balamuthia mandrillaris]